MTVFFYEYSQEVLQRLCFCPRRNVHSDAVVVLIIFSFSRCFLFMAFSVISVFQIFKSFTNFTLMFSSSQLFG